MAKSVDGMRDEQNLDYEYSGMTEALFVPSLFGPFLSEKYKIHGNRSVILGDFYPLKE